MTEECLSSLQCAAPPLSSCFSWLRVGKLFLLSGLSPSWRAVVGQEALAGLASLGAQLDSTAQLKTLEPPTHQVMRAFELEPEKVRVIIIGQDPYPGSGMASGLAFSVNPDVTALPASLKNIRAELSSDLGITLPPHGDLSLWSSRGCCCSIATSRRNAEKPVPTTGWAGVISPVQWCEELPIQADTAWWCCGGARLKNSPKTAGIYRLWHPHTPVLCPPGEGFWARALFTG